MAVLSVSELNRRAADLIRNHAALHLLLITGEIIDLKLQEHLYFSLRDADSCVNAIMFRKFAEQLHFMPENGMQVLAAAYAGIYEVSGRFQLYVTDMLSQGVGGIQHGLKERRTMLQKEGILDPTTRKKIPPHPEKIGVITSPDGAALQDILQILNRRAPNAQAVLFPVRVQGKFAEAEICQALEKADRSGCDVLILGRGGGSAEHLQIFDSEKIARAVHSCQTPIISAIGHETDFTLTDEAADLRAPTPSAAAELASPQKIMILSQDHTEISSIRQIHAGDILKICLPDGCVTVRTESEDCIMNEHNAKLHSYAERTETVLLEKTEELETKAKQNHMQIANLFNAMRHSLTAGGKRIRPALIYAFCEVCGGTPEQADTAACAMEMTHTSSLIFDDLPAMDNDDLRRGKPSCHKAFGEATAILAGDALICAPFGLLASDSNLSSEQKLQIIQILSEQEGAGGMIGGQMLDMQFETQEHVTLEELEIMCLGKTGALIKAACQIGCICGGGSPEQIRAAGNYGETLGLAFQMIDDILDVTSTTEQLGKPVGSDAEEHKTTFVTLLGVDAVRTRAEKLTAQAHEFLTMFDSSGDTCFLHALTDLLLTRIQ